MWKTHKATGIEFTSTGKVRGHTKLVVKQGYLIACRKVRSSSLPKGKRTYMVYVHRAVAQLFIGPPRGKHVNHKDGNKQNNGRTNLEYVTRAGNAKHAHATGLIDAKGESNGRSVLTEALVRKIRKLDPGKQDRGRNFARRNLARKIGMRYKITDTSVCNIWDGRTWAHVQ